MEDKREIYHKCARLLGTDTPIVDEESLLWWLIKDGVITSQAAMYAFERLDPEDSLKFFRKLNALSSERDRFLSLIRGSRKKYLRTLLFSQGFSWEDAKELAKVWEPTPKTFYDTVNTTEGTLGADGSITDLVEDNRIERAIGKSIISGSLGYDFRVWTLTLKKNFGDYISFLALQNEIELIPNLPGPTGQTGTNPGTPSYVSQVDLASLFTKKNGQPGCLFGITFAVHGKFLWYANRQAIESKIVSLGGSISKKVDRSTSVLVASSLNDCSKIRDAVKFGVPIITENQFVNHFCGGRIH